MKSGHLKAFVDFLYHGEANIYQEDLDSFLALAEELKLKGLTGESGDSELEEMKPDIIKKLSTNAPKQIRSELKIIMPLHKFEKESLTTIHSEVGTTTALMSQNETLSGVLQELNEKVKSMYSLSKQDGKGYYTCHVCGKKVSSNCPSNMREHIEANHIKGVSLPCNLCEKTFRSRKALRMHKSSTHKYDDQLLLQDKKCSPASHA